MRKNVKEQLEGMILLLEEAWAEMDRALSNQAYITAQELLEETYQAAIQMGTVIEQWEGEGFVTVGILEEYCERIYEVHKALSEAEPLAGAAEESRAELPAILERLKLSVAEDIKIRREAVFLPYKAAMWDSLEGMWRKAAEDPDWDAYVIPIPYYDKNPDGSLRQEHYEGKQYPEAVPITHYNDYNFAQNHPDVIFIHNPYDEHNTVTSVHPFFYSKNLKQFTDRLVYIPYFVLQEMNPCNRAAIECIEHLIAVSAVIHADTVIVQSENMRQIYIDVMTKEAGENTRAIWEEKIIGSGSPKLDKLEHLKKQELKLPEEWQRIIQKQDGDSKKIFLYNTSVTALLLYEERLLAKIRRVFEIFKENQAEAVLWWRPHPLLEATIASMRPQLCGEYEKIVEQYRREGWGIYDDTADLDRAIAFCDAYYGDGSSLVTLCRKAGKYIMIQDVDV